MIARRIASTIAGVALVGALGGGAMALANGGDDASPTPSPAAQVDDDGTADQGSGDAPGSPTGGDDDGTADQGPGDAPGTEMSGDDGSGGDDENSGPGSGDDDSSGPGGNSGQG